MALDNFQNDKALIIVYDGVEIKQYAKSKPLSCVSDKSLSESKTIERDK